MNHVAVHDILESDFDAPITKEVLRELGFEDESYFSGFSYEGVAHDLWAHKTDDGYIVNDDGWSSKTNPQWNTVGGLKLLLEALKGDE